MSTSKFGHTKYDKVSNHCVPKGLNLLVPMFRVRVLAKVVTKSFWSLVIAMGLIMVIHWIALQTFFILKLSIMISFNSFKPGVPFMGHRQTE